MINSSLPHESRQALISSQVVTFWTVSKLKSSSDALHPTPPCEIIGAILSNLDHPRHLLSALLICHHFYTSFKETPGIFSSILRNQLTPALVPLSVSLVEASRLPRPLEETTVLALLDELYNTPTHLVSRLPVSTLPVDVLQKMSRTHEAIHAMTTKFATSALDCISPANGSSSPVVNLSPGEYFRFCRAFYRLELFYILFRGKTGEFWDETTASRLFFSRNPIWENEQLFSVYDFLNHQFGEASREVAAHDIVMGEFDVDYLSSGSDNIWRQSWLSSGVKFVFKLTLTKTYEEKYKLFRTVHCQTYRDFPEAIIYTVPDWDIGLTVGEYPLEIFLEDSQSQDPDPGPFETWRKIHLDDILDGIIGIYSNQWLRLRGYVFWDQARIHKFPKEYWVGETIPDCTLEEFEEMRESWKERSKLWLMGREGYWSKDGESR
ncbi:hypothetical protein QBC35DRAFT_394605 [Podospora australis]|uniref:Uncharacterized protein n=1 Tax=Podospora australis TaxID=1536484 RepID=A0AAN7AE13_9PEZI|nr:hypothetical protein QBC35DRAFT_394605 [Podospora australis]